MKITLKAARINANLKQEQVAIKLGVTESTVSRWENGKTKVPKKYIDNLCKICNIDKDMMKEFE